MALSVTDLAVSLRLASAGESISNDLQRILSGLLATAEAVCERYAPNAPAAVLDEAEIRLAGYLFDAPEAPGGDRFAAAFRNSGGMALLSPWKVRRAGAI